MRTTVNVTYFVFQTFVLGDNLTCLEKKLEQIQTKKLAIGPKNEASTLKYFKLAETKDFTKRCLFGAPQWANQYQGIYLPFSCKKYQKKFAGPTSGLLR